MNNNINNNQKNNMNNSSNIQSNKPLPEVFKELKEARNKQFIEEKINANKWSFRELKEYGYEYIRRHNKFRSINKNITNVRTIADDVRYFLTTKSPAHVVSYLLIICVVIFALATMYSNYIYATDIEFETERKIVGTYEKNENVLDLDKIIEENSSVVRKKEVTTEVIELECEVVYTDNPLLPLGEEVVTEEGIPGKEKVTYINSYENDEIVESKEIKRVVTEEPTVQYVDVGTSEFLAEYNVHIGDTMYLAEDTDVRFYKNKNVDVGYVIPAFMDVTLKSIEDDWYVVSYENKDLVVTGYIENTNLRSETSDPDMLEKARIYRILNDVDIDMYLNRVSGLTEDDYVKIFTGISSDKNKIFENNATVFYEMEQKYNVNGLFIAAIGIHESGWGTSAIARDKNNLFGYGAYDSSPYESSYDFEDYREGIETLSKSMAKYYLNEDGVHIIDDEYATGKYYNGSTLRGVNIRYASDTEWCERVFATMESLYARLK